VNCQEARSKIDMFALEGLSPEEHAAVARHVGTCAECRACFDEARALTDAVWCVREQPPEAPDVQLATWFALSDAIQDEQACVSRRCVRSRLCYAAAAVFLVALSVVAVWWRAEPQREVTPYVAWQNSGLPELSGPGQSLYAIESGRIYALHKAGEEGSLSRLCAIDPKSGDRLWQSEPARIIGMAANGPRVIGLVSAGDGTHLTAWDAAHGQLLWEQPVGGVRDVVGQLTVLDSARVAFRSKDRVAVHDAETGRQLWSIDSEAPVRMLCRVDDGDLLASTDGGLQRFDGGSGAVTWQHATPGASSGRFTAHGLAAAAGRIYWLHSGEGSGLELTCLNVSSPVVAWSREVPRSAWHVLAEADDVYIRGREVMALDGASGKEKWSQESAGCGPMTLVDGELCFVDTTGDGRVVALDSTSGEPRWQVAGLLSCQPIRRRGGTGYVATQSGTLIAFALPDRL